MSADRGDRDSPSLIQAISDVSEKASLLVREEIELAKAEVGQKVTRLGKGAVVALAAGIFAFLGLIMLMHAIAWFLVWLIDTEIYVGFLITTGFFFLIAGIAAFIGYRWIKRSAPPTPDMAIEEARLIRETVKS